MSVKKVKRDKQTICSFENDYVNNDSISDETEENANIFSVSKSELQREKDLLNITLQSIGDGVISTTNNNTICLFNSAAQKLTGWMAEEAIGKPIDEVLNLLDESNRTRFIFTHENKKLNGILLSKDRNEYNVSVSIAPIINYNANANTNDSINVNINNQGIVIIFRDITGDRKREDEILYLSYHDALTGLYNRRFFEEEMKRLDSVRQLPISVIMGDVNGLKLVNDVFGHSVGDMLLRSAAKIIKGACRAEDIIARWGGDEFIILLPQTSNRELQKICSRITNQCALYEDMSFPVKISISLGCASKEQMEQNLETMLKRAEDLMYKNKLFESINLRNVIVNSIKKTLYEKSHETESHVERLKELCRLIGIGMGLSDTNLAELDLLSVLHDLGKIAIKNSILNKPVRLTTDEWREMRRHPEIGYRIAQSSPELFHIAEYILSHHERWDSRGYPRGLKGEDIPLLSRIFAVADAYDSMTNERPYRKPLTNQEAVDVILKNSGTQFDPGIVRVFVTELLISKRIGKIS